MRWLYIFFLLCTLLACAPNQPDPQPPSNFENTLVTTVPQPTAFAFTPDRKMLIASKSGVLNVYTNGGLGLALDLSSKICDGGERGLLGVAVDPEFSANNFVYLYYTFKKGTNCDDVVPVNRVSRFVLNSANRIDVSSEKVLIDNVPSFGSNHNGGDVQFGKDGYLYISIGDGGCDYTQQTGCAGANAIARSNYHLLGKILRIAKDGGIPADNPFVSANSARCNVTGSTDTDKVCQEIYATGLRNPFRIAFDPNSSETRFYINDVGQDAWEEINVGSAGADYGWNLREGKCANGSTTNCAPPPPNVVDPLFAYKHGSNPTSPAIQNCNSITAGAFVPKGVWPASYDDVYLFADFVCDKIFALNADTTVGLLIAEAGPVVHMSFGPLEQTQALYYSSFANGGEIRRIVYVYKASR